MDKSKALFGAAVLLTICFISQHAYFLLAQRNENDELSMASSPGIAMLQTAVGDTGHTKVSEEPSSYEQSPVRAVSPRNTAKTSASFVAERSEKKYNKGIISATTMQAALNMIAALKDKVYSQDQRIEEMAKKQEVMERTQMKVWEDSKISLPEPNSSSAIPPSTNSWALEVMHKPPVEMIETTNAVLESFRAELNKTHATDMARMEKQQALEKTNKVLALGQHALEERLDRLDALLLSKSQQGQGHDEQQAGQQKKDSFKASNPMRLRGEKHAKNAKVPAVQAPTHRRSEDM